MSAVLHIGLVVNPLAGLGGSLGLKGSDGEILRDRLPGLTPQQRHRALDRVERALRPLLAATDSVRYSTWSGNMGAETLQALGMPHQVLGGTEAELTSSADTRNAAQALCDADVDLILFAGGDGTARDIFDVVGGQLPRAGDTRRCQNAFRRVRSFAGGGGRTTAATGHRRSGGAGTPGGSRY